MADLPADVVVLAAYRLSVLVLVLFAGFAVRSRFHWPVGVAVLAGVASNIAFLTGHLSLSGLFGIPYIGLMGWVFIDYMGSDHRSLRALLGKKEAQWSRERHDLINDNAALRARLAVYEADDVGPASDQD